MTSTLPPLVQAISGALGSASANTLTYPLDLVTTRVQLASSVHSSKGKGKEKDPEAQKKFGSPADRPKALGILRSIVQEDGVRALYDGILTDTASTIVSSFFYFYIYSFLRKLLIRRLTGSQSPSLVNGNGVKPNSVPAVKLTVWQDLILGYLSGVASRVVSMPLSIITLQLQTGRHNDETEGKGVARVVRRIYREHGLAGFWRGFNTTLIVSLNPSITMTFFQLFQRLLALSRPTRTGPKVLDPTPLEAFFGGALSNSLAVAILYPLILAKTRLQASRKSSASSSPRKTLRTTMLDAYMGNGESTGQNNAVGIKGLYQGLEMQIFKGFFNMGVTFLVKRRIEQAVVRAYMRHKLGRTGINIPMPVPIPLSLYSDDPYRVLEEWNIVEHVGRRYL